VRRATAGDGGLFAGAALALVLWCIGAATEAVAAAVED
jgi:hypothetical protein